MSAEFFELPELPEPPLDPRRAESIRRRAHAVLDGRVPARPHPAELALVVVFSVGLVIWVLAAIVQPVA